MIKLIRNKRKQYHKTIMDQLEHYSYRHERYNFNFSLAIGLSVDELDLRAFETFKRKTDEFVILEEFLCALVLDGSDVDTAIKATSNVQTQFQTNYFNKKLYVVVASAHDYDNKKSMVNALFDMLEYAIKHEMDSVILDKSQLLLQGD